MRSVCVSNDTHAPLDSGNFSRVYHGYRNGKTEVALKCIDKRRFWSTPKTKEQLLREADILRDVKHPNIITVYDVIDSEQFLYLVLELYAPFLDRAQTLKHDPSPHLSVCLAVRQAANSST